MSDPIVRASDEHAAGALPTAVGVGDRRSGKDESSPHSHRFQLAIAFLLGIAIAAVGVSAVLVSRHRTKPKPAVPWSSWRPTDQGTLGAREIADEISPLYRLSSVQQLAVVTVANVISPNSAHSGATGLQVAVQNNPSSQAVSVLNGNTIAYNMCGIAGPNCQIGGTDSSRRLLLLRREALELALYTFKYISGTDNVLAILPPGKVTTNCVGLCKQPQSKPTTSTIDVAVLFRRNGLQPLLAQPLSDTFPEQYPPSVSQMSAAPEAGLVDQVTARWLFSEQVVQAQDGSNLIVLAPLPPE